ncbi:hypothetical protein [Sporosarcina cyprini]|uniref:hypothetical protein n=1 Tax=Sporosarcina cyprini TaxID=2910523 RepID=UPI001EDE59DD|nr:hypothetical protein [Sporosarcina cyprini]MCG3087763.1 hypothetical protein [Sporosarcina cyprini]
MDSKLWKLGFFTALTSFVLLILGTRTILGNQLEVKNYLTFAVFGLTVGMLATLLRFYKMKAGFWIFMASLVIGFAEMFRSFIMDKNGWGDIAGILSLFIITSFGFGITLIVQAIKMLLSSSNRSNRSS